MNIKHGRACSIARFGFPLLLAASGFLGGCSDDKPAEPPVPRLDKASLDFGEVTVGDAAERSFTVTNLGSGTVSGAMAESCEEFSIISGGGSYALERDESVEVIVRFTPASAGMKSCAVGTGNGFLGNVTCSGTGLSADPGACCDELGSCTLTTEAECSAGEWLGAGTDCTPDPCAARGACCALDGTCMVTTEAVCKVPSVWQGADTVCDPHPCPPGTITVSPASIPEGIVGIPYSQTFSASGGTAPYAFAISAGALPPGLVLAADGGLSGTPAETGDFTFTVEATDDLGLTGSRGYTVAITFAAANFDLTVPAVYITQATQTPDFDVPLVKGRDGFLRAFVVANEANSETPDVRVRIYNGAALVQTYTIAAPGSSVGTSIDEGALDSSWNQRIPGSLLQPGHSILVDVDPGDEITEAHETNNQWPGTGTPSPLDVRDLSVLQMTVVPVEAPLGTGNVTPGNAPTFMDYTRRMHPIPDYDATVRAKMTSSTMLHANGNGWETMLNEVTALRTADGGTGYYYGVVRVNYSSGVAGLGWIGHPVAIGWDYLPSGSKVLAHEIGHNFDRTHAACNGEPGTDPEYPYANGIIGVYGYDLWTSTQLDKTTHRDLMSYCDPQWISDYTYEGVLSYRENSPYDRPADRRPAPEEPCLLVWGIRKNGEITLEPSFHITTRPSVPEAGPYRVEGLNAAGGVIWSQEFEMMQIAHLQDPSAAGFNFAVPMPGELLDRIVALRIVEHGAERVRRESAVASPGRLYRQTSAPVELVPSGDGVALTWEVSHSPVVMVRDLDRDAWIGVARGGRARIATANHGLELRFSDGVHTRVEIWDGR